MSSADLGKKLREMQVVQSPHQPSVGDLDWLNRALDNLSASARGDGFSPRNIGHYVGEFESRVLNFAQRGFKTQAIELTDKRYAGLEKKYNLADSVTSK